MFSNWAVIYVHEEKGLPAQAAALSLTCFWAALTFGRFIVSLLVVRVKPVALLIALPLLIVCAFIVVANIETAPAALASFALAGFACSGFFPLHVAFSAAPFPQHVSWVASILNASMMVGVGIGSYVIGAMHTSTSIATLYEFSILYPLGVIALLGLAYARQRSSDSTPLQHPRMSAGR
jgi:FHS family glucose/mannose:H+ symporter-like MFS transporter